MEICVYVCVCLFVVISDEKVKVETSRCSKQRFTSTQIKRRRKDPLQLDPKDFVQLDRRLDMKQGSFFETCAMCWSAGGLTASSTGDELSKISFFDTSAILRSVFKSTCTAPEQID